MGDRWGEVPFAAITPVFIAGVFSAGLLRESSFAGLAAGAMLVAGAAALAWSRRRPRAAWILALSALFAGALLLSLARRDSFPESDLRALLARGALPLEQPLGFEGCIDAPVLKRADQISLEIRVRGLQLDGRWVRAQGRVLLRVPGAEASGGTEVEHAFAEGDRIRGWASFRKPRNFQNPGAVDHRGYLARRGIYVIARAKTARLLEILPGECAGAWNRMLAALRARLSSALDRLGSRGQAQQAAVLSSIILGDYSMLDASVRERFLNSGTYHVLVVSGLHVGWIAWALLSCCRLLRFPHALARTAVALAILVYAGMVGFQASISRALWMFLLYLAGQSLFRRADPANIALAAALLLLAIEPGSVFDVGFQLSFLAVLAICLTALPIIRNCLQPLLQPLRHAGDAQRLFHEAGRWHRAGRRLRIECEIRAEALADRIGGTAEKRVLAPMRLAAGAASALASMVVVSLCVQLWLEPLLAFHFNRLSWIAVAANLVLVPLSSLLLAAGIVAVLASGLPWAGELLLSAAAWLSSVLLAGAGWFSNIPGAWQRCPTPHIAWVVSGIIAVFAWSFMGWKRAWISWAGIGLLLISLASGTALLPGLDVGGEKGSAGRRLRLTFLDVGDGDAIVIETGGGKTWILDAGGVRHAGESQETTFDIGEAVVSRYLWSRWITRLDRVIVSHPDIDHAGGIPALLRNFTAAHLHHAPAADDPVLDRVLAAASKRGARVSLLHAGMSIREGLLTVEVLSPPSGAPFRSSNDNSVVLRLAYGNFSALLTGDMERHAEQALLERDARLESLLLKVAHHGSRSGTTEPFARGAMPAWAVISTGRYNPFGHPSAEVVRRLLRQGSRLLLTQDLGAVVLETDGERYWLWSHICGTLEEGPLPPR